MVGYFLRRTPTPHAFANQDSCCRGVCGRSVCYLQAAVKHITVERLASPRSKDVHQYRHWRRTLYPATKYLCTQIDERCAIFRVLRVDQKTSIREWKTLKCSRSSQSALPCFHNSAVEGKIADGYHCVKDRRRALIQLDIEISRPASLYSRLKQTGNLHRRFHRSIKIAELLHPCILPYPFARKI